MGEVAENLQVPRRTYQCRQLTGVLMKITLAQLVPQSECTGNSVHMPFVHGEAPRGGINQDNRQFNHSWPCRDVC